MLIELSFFDIVNLLIKQCVITHVVTAALYIMFNQQPYDYFCLCTDCLFSSEYSTECVTNQMPILPARLPSPPPMWESLLTTLYIGPAPAHT